MPVQLDFSKAQPINPPTGGVVLDFSKAQPIEQKGALGSFADASGLSALAHPVDTILGLPAALRAEALRSAGQLKEAWNTPNNEPIKAVDRTLYAIPFIGGSLKNADQQAAAGNYAGAAGTGAGVITGLLAPEAVKGALKAAPVVARAGAGAVEATGDAAQSAAGGIINRAAGTLKSDFKRGANPGRGYLREGGGVAGSMQGLADNAKDAAANVTQKLNDTYKAADASGKVFPVQDVANAVGKPMQDAVAVATGPGAPQGLAAQISHLSDTFNDTFQKGIENGGFTPSQVWDLKKQIAKATNWSNATDVGIKQIKQQQVGALSGLLSDAFPELKPLNESFMDLKKLADRAQERADTGSEPLTGHLRDIGAMVGGGELFGGHEGGMAAAAGVLAAKAARSIPARTAAASALYNSGKFLSAAGQKAGAFLDRSGSAAADIADEAGNTVSEPIQGQAPPQMVRPNFNEPLQEYIRRKKAARAQK